MSVSVCLLLCWHSSGTTHRTFTHFFTHSFIHLLQKSTQQTCTHDYEGAVENKHLPENVLQPINYVSQTHTPIKHGSDKRTAGWVAASLNVLHFGSGGITVIKGKCVNQHIALMTVGGYDTKLCTLHAPSLTLWHRHSIFNPRISIARRHRRRSS